MCCSARCKQFDDKNMQNYSKDPHFGYHHYQCYMCPAAPSYPQTYMYAEPQFVRQQLPTKPFKSPFSIESLLDRNNKPSPELVSFTSHPAKQESSVAAKLRELENRRRKENTFTPYSTHGEKSKPFTGLHTSYCGQGKPGLLMVYFQRSLL